LVDSVKVYFETGVVVGADKLDSLAGFWEGKCIGADYYIGLAGAELNFAFQVEPENLPTPK
jgi:hypothetical protein